MYKPLASESLKVGCDLLVRDSSSQFPPLVSGDKWQKPGVNKDAKTSGIRKNICRFPVQDCFLSSKG